jgi:rhodanese-related sulfurtransferase
VRTAYLTLTALALALGACSTQPAERAAPEDSARAAELAADPSRAFRRSPGGTFEIDPRDVERLLRAPAAARIIDIREPDELVGGLGHIDGVEVMPFSALAPTAERWDPEEPVILICRTGRRSARAVSQLEALGLRNLASMTGGMLRWSELGLPVSQDISDVRAVAAVQEPRADLTVEVTGSEGAPPLAIDVDEVRWIRTASLLSTGSESCVDGRDEHAVVGTPGGDAGEFIVALATAESLGAPALDRRGLEALVDDWIDAFGRFYVHTDVHALEHLRETVRADRRFTARGVAPADAAEMESLVRHPPPGLEEALLEHLTAPANVGCGHLRAMLKSPDEFGVRPALPSEVLRAVFQHLFREPEGIDWVVLEGEHHEQAVVIVELDGEIHPYTKVPAIPPSIDGRQTFVFHPQVTAYLREQNASFLLERSPSFAGRVDRALFVDRMRALADTQREATLQRLADGLPVYEARFHAARSR